jgi:hypothetical protein
LAYKKKEKEKKTGGELIGLWVSLTVLGSKGYSEEPAWPHQEQ